ncbi:MAG: hypothetical protein B7Y39_12010 [Bdellovibrio sp. 28-41-41]|nr:MAG: hypothetical protein B7Y39_12010 [Bdellovibrio sp. 28-41-41]
MSFVKKRRNGFSLIEMLVTVALLGILIAGINSLVVGSYSSLRLLKAESFIKTFNLNVDAFLNSQRSCNSTLAAINPVVNGKVLPSIKNITGGDVFVTPVTGMNEVSNPITLRSMVISNLAVAGTSANFNIQMNYEYTNGAVVVPLSRLINIVAEVDGANNVLNCSSFNGLNPESLFVKVDGNEVKTGDLTITGNLNIGVGAADTSFIDIMNVPAAPLHNLNFFNSDRSLKKDLAPLSDSVEKIKELKAYRYRFKNSKEWRIGFLAQDVEKIAPHAVLTSAEGHKMVSYKSLLPYVWEYHKSVYSKRQALLSRLEALENKKD